VKPIRIAPGVAFPVPSPAQVWTVGALIRDLEGRVFVQRRIAGQRLLPGEWDIVGGHVEQGETLLDALAREITEETGWHLERVHRSLGVVTWTGDDGILRTEADFVVEVSGNLANPRPDPTEHDRWRWITYDEIQSIEAESPVLGHLLGRTLRLVMDGAGEST
jgi:8-oxo-dGTP diphosphatase